ncbi:MAG: iron ABC transporter permease [Tissierellia bacterium]|nr:iron ABC transporter permease [Tissierellia bacterium]
MTSTSTKKSSDAMTKTSHIKRNPKKGYTLAFLFLLSLLGGLVLLNLVSGSVDLGLGDLYEVLFQGRALSRLEYNVLYKIRLPRIISAILFGMALSVSGFLLQTFFRNPIVGPSVLGITSGARLFVGLIILGNFGLGLQVQSLGLFFVFSMVGSLLAMVLVLIFAKRSKSLSTLVVIGIMIGYIATAITNFMMTFSDEHKIAGLTMWGLGSFSGVNWDMIRVSLIIIIPSIIMTFLSAKSLQAFLLGESYAMTMGLDIKKFRFRLIILSSCLTACVTAFAGPISFVGIAVPHISRILFKSANPKILVPAICLTGANFCLLSDYLARTLFAPIELNISVITSLIGAPIVIYLMTRRTR